MFQTVLKTLFEGFGTTLQIFFLTLLGALPLGLIIAFGSMSKFKPLKCLVKTVVWVIRGTPLMLQLLVIYRGGIESIATGQTEAGLVLGMTKSQIFFKVILLQVVKRIVPPMSNEIITLVKDTSLARIIAVYELIWSGQTFIKGAAIIWPLFFTGIFYLAFCGILTILFGLIEKKLSYFR